MPSTAPTAPAAPTASTASTVPSAPSPLSTLLFLLFWPSRLYRDSSSLSRPWSRSDPLSCAEKSEFHSSRTIQHPNDPTSQLHVRPVCLVIVGGQAPTKPLLSTDKPLKRSTIATRAHDHPPRQDSDRALGCWKQASRPFDSHP